MTQPPIPEGELKQKLKAIIVKGDYDFHNGISEGVLMLMTEAYELGQKAQAGGEPLYTKEQLLELVRTKLHEVYGGLSKDQNGRKINTPYTVLGILHDAIPDFPTARKANAPINKENP